MSTGGERWRFLRSFFASPRGVGAVLPTSRRAVRDTLALAPPADARLVVELGAGTGVYTREILAQLEPEGRLLAFEIDSGLARTLEEELDDPRLQVVCESALELSSHLEGEQPDLIVSALPFTSLPGELGRRILRAASAALAPGGTLLVLQYSPLIERELRRAFASVNRRISPVNVPPAFLFACREPVAGGAEAPRAGEARAR
jgi:phospholipid N-methyltransferase